jgi:putative colanic acid biosynthesis glycosyltransferase
MKLLQINTVLNSGSTGHIAEEIGITAMTEGHGSYIAAAYTNRPSSSEVVKIGSDTDRKIHGVKTRLSDRHGFGSKRATIQLIERIKEIDPDIINLHNIHGYYLNIEVMFEYLKNAGKPIVWTLHDCWPFTGHCAHYQYVNCNKWKTQCHHCPNINGYPASWLVDNSRGNYSRKKEIFSKVDNLTIVVPSGWLHDQLPDSFLKNYPARLIYNGINTDIFKPGDKFLIRSRLGIGSRKLILGVSGIWSHQKGLNDFFQIREKLDKDVAIVLVGLNKEQAKRLPEGITGIERTESISELVDLYSAADVFVNPTYVDNFPSVNIEALSCGTPVVTYNTGGSPEAVDQNTGLVVEKGNIKELIKAVLTVINTTDRYTSDMCRERVISLFSAKERFGDYLRLYEEILVETGIQSGN